MAAVLLLAACAEGQADQSVTPQQTAAIRATCSRVMRLRQGEAEFDGCVSDLSDTVAWEVRRARTTLAYGYCAASGLTRESPQFARCVLDREGAQKAAGMPAAGKAVPLNVADVKPADTDPDSYYSANFDIRHRREQYACAQMGLEPDSGPFVSCVNNIETDLFNIAHPPG